MVRNASSECHSPGLVGVDTEKMIYYKIRKLKKNKLPSIFPKFPPKTAVIDILELLKLRPSNVSPCQLFLNGYVILWVFKVCILVDLRTFSPANEMVGGGGGSFPIFLSEGPILKSEPWTKCLLCPLCTTLYFSSPHFPLYFTVFAYYTYLSIHQHI